MPYVPPHGTKPIPGFPNYVVSADGVVYSNRVYGSKTRRTGPWWVMKPKTRAKYKHTYVDLFREVGKPERFFVHQLVLLAFVGPCPEGEEVRHLNDVGNDNRLENLEYGTRKENLADAMRNGKLKLGEDRARSRRTNEKIREIKRLLRNGVRSVDIARAMHETPKFVIKIKRGEIWRTIV